MSDDIIGASIEYLLKGDPGERRARLAHLNELEKDAVLHRLLTEREQVAYFAIEEFQKLTKPSQYWRMATMFFLGVIAGIGYCFGVGL